MASLCILFEEPSCCVPQRLHHPPCSPAKHKGSNVSTSSPTLVTFWFFDDNPPSGCEVPTVTFKSVSPISFRKPLRVLPGMSQSCILEPDRSRRETARASEPQGRGESAGVGAVLARVAPAVCRAPGGGGKRRGHALAQRMPLLQRNTRLLGGSAVCQESNSACIW